MTFLFKHDETHSEPKERRSVGSIAAVIVLAALSVPGYQATHAQSAAPTNTLIATMLKNEDFEAAHKGHYEYVAQERSDRTGGHLWTERVAETDLGKLRLLIAVDGQPLSNSAAEAEKARLSQIAADPAGFQKSEQAKRDDEAHALTLLNLLPQAFTFSNEHMEGRFVRIDFQPNPSYSPRSLEERVLHGMSGSMLVDPQVARLRQLQARLPADVDIGFGILASIHAGSSFSTMRSPVPGHEWKTVLVDTDVRGRAILFKSIAKQEHVEHSGFAPIPLHLSLSQAMQILESK